MQALRAWQPIALTLVLSACGGGGNGSSQTSDLEKFDAGFFSIQKPRGWSVTTAGSCETFAVLLEDPAEPLRQIFYFGTIGPVYVSEQQKQIDQAYVHAGGFAIPWIDAPAVDPLTPESFMTHWPEIAQMKAATAFMSKFPRLAGLKLVSTVSRASMLSGATTGESRGVFTLDGRVGEGMFLSSVIVYFPFNGSPGAGTAYGHFVCGVTTPKSELAGKAQLLVASLDSFTVTSAYVQGCMAQAQAEWGAVAAAGRTLSEASDLIWDGWQARSHTEDISAAKYSDAFREVERVYDPSSGTVYEVPAGWYAAYDADRSGYDMQGLEQLPATAWDLWMKATASGSQIH